MPFQYEKTRGPVLQGSVHTHAASFHPIISAGDSGGGWTGRGSGGTRFPKVNRKLPAAFIAAVSD